MTGNDKTTAATVACRCGRLCNAYISGFAISGCVDQQKPGGHPCLTGAEEQCLRSYGDRLTLYGRETDDRRALAAADCLTFVLIEAGLLP